MNAAFNRYCKKVTVDLTEFCEGDSHHITVREPTTGEVKTFFKIEKVASKLKNDEGIEDFCQTLKEVCDILPQMITEHDFYELNNPSQKVSAKDVSEFVASDFNIASKVTMEIMKNLPLVKGNVKK